MRADADLDYTVSELVDGACGSGSRRQQPSYESSKGLFLTLAKAAVP